MYMYVHVRLFEPIAEIVVLHEVGPFLNPNTYGKRCEAFDLQYIFISSTLLRCLRQLMRSYLYVNSVEPTSQVILVLYASSHTQAGKSIFVPQLQSL